MDLILSSGFLAFARHIGFLGAVEEAGIEVDGVYGTSSGALVGALWAAGLSADQLAQELSEERPLASMRFHWKVWRGLFTLAPLAERLSTMLPETFAELDRPFGVGVATAAGGHRLLTAGPLVPSVLASCAIPHLFEPICIEGSDLSDGGAVDRLGLDAWRDLRGEREVIAHLVERSHGVRDRVALAGAVVVSSPRSGASFYSLGDFPGQVREAREATLRRLESERICKA